MKLWFRRESEWPPGSTAAVSTTNVLVPWSTGETITQALHHHSDTVAVTGNPTKCICDAADRHYSLFFIKHCEKMPWLCTSLTLSVSFTQRRGSGAKPCSGVEQYAAISHRCVQCIQLNHFPSLLIIVRDTQSVLFLSSQYVTKDGWWPCCNITQCSWSRHQPWLKFHSGLQTHCTV